MSARKKKSKENEPPLLSQRIRNEVRMFVALRDYAKIKCGRSMRLPDQHDTLRKLYHGQETSNPPQIKLFFETQLNYRDFFDTKII